MIVVKRAVASAVALGAILMYSLVPLALAATTLEVSGNGSGSNNTVSTNTSQSNTVVQQNDAVIRNDIQSNAKSGGNNANDNTGSNVRVLTGNASSSSDISNAANMNRADLGNCGSCNTDSAATISGNGSDSTNNVQFGNTSSNSVFQSNRADFDNRIHAAAETGKNDLNRNTGGDVMLLTGHATSDVTVANKANANVASIGEDTSGTGTLSAIISGNGSRSDNQLSIDNSRAITLVQQNDAVFRNDVWAKAKTGGNNVNDNTNGNVTVDTGDASTSVNVDNMANFNAANVDCCLEDVMARITGNGSGSENEIGSALENALSVFQGESDQGADLADFSNRINAEAAAGNTSADRNTGSVLGNDMLLITGNTTSNTTVQNAGNANIFGRNTDLQIPGISEGVNLNLSFDLSDLLSLLNSRV